MTLYRNYLRRNIIESKFVFPELHYRIIFKLCTKKWKFAIENPRNQKKKNYMKFLS